MIDENGNPPLKPMPKAPNWVISMWTILGAAAAGIGYTVLRMIAPGSRSASTMLAAGVGIMAVGGLLILLGITRPGRVLRARQAGRRALAIQRLAGAPEVGAIGKTESGTVRVRGKVKILRAVHAPRTGEPVAAFETDDEREGGRFAIVDDTGVAIVDDDCFELWARDPATGTLKVGGGRVADGAAIEVLGTAARGPAIDVAGLASDPHYREAAQALLFDGKPGAPVLLLIS